ncbi:MAG: CBS domain-containing protein, partial [FCB group bacterium]|nr:CBS domain-containing protein [FCB group bacterium]
MLVKDLIKARPLPITVKSGQTIQEAMQLLNYHKIGSLVVVDDKGKPTGIITERDIFRLAYTNCAELLELLVGDHMSDRLVIGLPDDELDYIAQIITQNRIRHIPIMDENKKLCGIVSIGDVVKARLDEAEVHARYLTEYILGTPL